MRLSIVMSLSISLFTCTAYGEDWSRFRGPNGTGVADSGKLPDALSIDSNLKWRVPCGAGASSPIIIGNTIITTSSRDDQRLTQCWDLSSGKELWSNSIDKQRDEIATKPNGPATPTSVSDGKKIVSFFSDAGLVCYDLSGHQVWENKTAPSHSMHGLASSLVIAGTNVVVVSDQLRDSHIAAYSLETGKLAWKTPRPDGLTGGYSTPTLITTDEGAPQLVVPGPLELVGYDARTGDRTWWIRGVSNAPVSVPVLANNQLFLCEPVGEAYSMSMLSGYDANKDAKISLEEVKTNPAMLRLMGSIDKRWGNNDEVVEAKEWDEAFGTLLKKGGLVSVNLGGTGDLTETNIAWSYTRKVPYVASVIHYEDTLFFVQDGGIFTSLNPESGDVLKQGRLKKSGQFYASPVAGDGKVYLANTQGDVTVLSAKAEWEIVSATKLPNGCVATPAISNGCIVVRTSKELLCFHNKS